MVASELTVRVRFTPNCGLQNTRASLILRRISRLCGSLASYPENLKGDRSTIPYLRDEGLFVTFSSDVPEQVMFAISSSFFVEDCTIVEDRASIPPFEAVAAPQGQRSGGVEAGTPVEYEQKQEDELLALLARVFDIKRSLRAYAADRPDDRELGDLLFAHEQAVDTLRTIAMKARLEPFARIAPSLQALVADQCAHFGVEADLEVAETFVLLDRSVLGSIEEALKRLIRMAIRSDIEGAAERQAAGKPVRATLRVRLENDGSSIACRFEHDGRGFDALSIGMKAQAGGVLTRPLETYTDKEIGRLIFLPRFSEIITGEGHGGIGFELGEISAMLHRTGGSGEVRNTDRGTVEALLRFPVPFTVFEAVLVERGGAAFALPAHQIERFEAYRPDRLAPEGFYVDETGTATRMIGYRNREPLPEAARPTTVALAHAGGERWALAVDRVRGYERVLVSRLPRLMDRQIARLAGCLGYAVSADGSVLPVLNVRLLADASSEGGPHA